MSTTRIVVVGGGIAGVPLAYALKGELGARAEVTLVCDRPEFHFVPANPWLALGLREEREVCFELKPLLAPRDIELRTEPLRAIDPGNNCITLAGGTELAYDYLALATGIRPDWERVPCTGANARAHSLILANDAAAARGSYLEFLKQPGPIVVAAAAGASTIGPMYEYAFLLDADLRRRGKRARAPISIVTPEPYLGHLGLDKPVVSDALETALAKHAIDWTGNAALQDCHNQRLRFTIHNGETGERHVDFAYAMIWPPFRGIDAVAQCPELADAHGLIPVDNFLRSLAHETIFAVGACIAKPAITNTPVPVGVPDAVYPIQQQLATVARNIAHSLRGESLENAGIDRERWIADMGKRGAAYLSAPQMPLRNINWLRQGRWVFEAKRDFEDYFINRILLGAGKHGHVAALIQRLRNRTRYSAGEERPAPLGPNLSVSTELRHEIEVLAQHLDINSGDLARRLLESAMAEARSYLDRETREQVDTAIRAHRIEALDAERERVRFEGGAP